MKAFFYGIIYPLTRPFFLVFLILNTLILGMAVIVLSLIDGKGNLVHYIGKFWSLFNLHLTGTRLTVKGREKIERGKPYIVMSNHQSLFDVWALIGRFALPKGTMALMPGKMEIIVGDPIDPAKYGEEDQEKLMNDVKSAIEKNLDLDYGSLLRPVM